MWIQSLGWEDPLKEEMATHSSILARKIRCSMDRGAWQATVHGVPESDTTEQAHNIYLNQKIILINTLARELEN